MRDWGERVASRSIHYLYHLSWTDASHRSVPVGTADGTMTQIGLAVPMDEQRFAEARSVSSDTLPYVCDKSDIKTCGARFQFQRATGKTSKALGGIKRLC